MTFVLFGLPVSLWYWRASFSADSTASPPPVVKNTRLRSPGASSASLRRELDRRRVRVGPVREEAELAGLVGAGLGHVLAAVADVDAEQRAQAVEVAVAVLVPDVAAVAADDDRDLGAVGVGAHAAEVHPEVALGQLLERALLRRGLGRRHAFLHFVTRVDRSVQRYWHDRGRVQDSVELRLPDRQGSQGRIHPRRRMLGPCVGHGCVLAASSWWRPCPRLSRLRGRRPSLQPAASSATSRPSWASIRRRSTRASVAPRRGCATA